MATVKALFVGFGDRLPKLKRYNRREKKEDNSCLP